MEGCGGSWGHGIVSLRPVVAGSPPPSCLIHTPTIGKKTGRERKGEEEERKREEGGVEIGKERRNTRGKGVLIS